MKTTYAASAWRCQSPLKNSRTADRPQALLIHTAPTTYFKPRYVGVRGWIEVELSAIGDDRLAEHIREAWRLMTPKTLR